MAASLTPPRYRHIRWIIGIVFAVFAAGTYWDELVASIPRFLNASSSVMEHVATHADETDIEARQRLSDEFDRLGIPPVEKEVAP